MLRRGLCLLLTAALCLTTGCVADRAAMQAEAEQALLAQQEEALRQEEAERRARQEERRRQAGEVLHAEMEEICRKYQVVGMSLAVFDEEGVFYRQSYGYADVEAGIPAGEDTIYRAASVSKCVTALLALDLASEGKIDPEAPLPRLGRCEVVSRYPDAPITLRHLLTHTAGMADSETYRKAVAEKVLPPLGEVLESCYTGAKPGTQYCYTNFGLGLVSGVMEAVTGERFLDYTREQVFEPMGMDAAYSYSQLTHPERVANIYQNGECTVRMVEWTGMSAKYTVLPLGELYALGHGDLFITAEDLARLGAIMAGCPGEGEAVALSEEYRLAMQTPQYERELAEGSYPNELCRGLGPRSPTICCRTGVWWDIRGTPMVPSAGCSTTRRPGPALRCSPMAHWDSAMPQECSGSMRTPPRRSMRPSLAWSGKNRTVTRPPWKPPADLPCTA